MGKIAEGIVAAKNGDIKPLLAAMTNLPSRTGGYPDPWSDDYPAMIRGESFDDVTVAWIAGQLTDSQYRQAVAAATPHTSPDS